MAIVYETRENNDPFSQYYENVKPKATKLFSLVNVYNILKPSVEDTYEITDYFGKKNQEITSQELHNIFRSFTGIKGLNIMQGDVNTELPEYPKGMAGLDKKESASAEELYWIFYRLDDVLQDLLVEQQKDPAFGAKKSIDLHEVFKPYDDLKLKFHELGVDNDKVDKSVIDYFIRIIEDSEKQEYDIPNFREFYETMILPNLESRHSESLNSLNLKTFDVDAFDYLNDVLIKEGRLKSTDLGLLKPVLLTYVQLYKGDKKDKEIAERYISGGYWINDLKESLKKKLELFNEDEVSKSLYTLNSIRKETPILDTYLKMIKGFERFTNMKLSEEDREYLFEDFINHYYTLPVETAKEILVSKLDVSSIEDAEEFKPEISPFKGKIDESVEELNESKEQFITTDINTNAFMVPVLEEMAETTNTPKDVVKQELLEKYEATEDVLATEREWLIEIENDSSILDAETVMTLGDWLEESKNEEWYNNYEQDLLTQAGLEEAAS